MGTGCLRVLVFETNLWHRRAVAKPSACHLFILSVMAIRIHHFLADDALTVESPEVAIRKFTVGNFTLVSSAPIRGRRL